MHKLLILVIFSQFSQEVLVEPSDAKQRTSSRETPKSDEKALESNPEKEARLADYIKWSKTPLEGFEDQSDVLRIVQFQKEVEVARKNLEEALKAQHRDNDTLDILEKELSEAPDSEKKNILSKIKLQKEKLFESSALLIKNQLIIKPILMELVELRFAETLRGEIKSIKECLHSLRSDSEVLDKRLEAKKLELSQIEDQSVRAGLRVDWYTRRRDATLGLEDGEAVISSMNRRLDGLIEERDKASSKCDIIRKEFGLITKQLLDIKNDILSLENKLLSSRKYLRDKKMPDIPEALDNKKDSKF